MRKLTDREQAVADRIEKMLNDPAYDGKVETLSIMILDSVNAFDATAE